MSNTEELSCRYKAGAYIKLGAAPIRGPIRLPMTLTSGFNDENNLRTLTRNLTLDVSLCIKHICTHIFKLYIIKNVSLILSVLQRKYVRAFSSTTIFFFFAADQLLVPRRL